MRAGCSFLGKMISGGKRLGLSTLPNSKEEVAGLQVWAVPVPEIPMGMSV